MKGNKVYTLSMEIEEGSDEFWEELAEMTGRQAKAELKHALQLTLADAGYFNTRITMGKTRR